jgi:phosphopantetheinyl transferase
VIGTMKLSVTAWPITDVSSRLATHDAVVCATSLLASNAELARSLRLLSSEERARHETFTNAVVARRFAVGRAMLREILGCALGLAPDVIPLREGLHGKPRLARGTVRPLWFSVAHAEEVLLVAMSRVAEVGVDLERARAIEQWERVADRVLAPAERAQLQRAVDEGEDVGSAFLRHWCRVEAELKAIGCGIVGLEDHRAGKRPLGLRLRDLNDLPLPAELAESGVRYQGAVALCASGVDSARHAADASSQAATPTIPPARPSTT